MVVSLFNRTMALRRHVLKILSSFVSHVLIVSTKAFNDCSFVVVFGGLIGPELKKFFYCSLLSTELQPEL